MAMSLASRLAARYQVDILTTCARDYTTWKNEFPPGQSSFGPVSVLRFAVDLPRDLRRFDRASRYLSEGRQPSIEDQEEWMSMQGPISSALLDYLRAQADDYSAFIFLPYLYATTYFGLPIVARRAVLMPLAHDEWMLCLPMWDNIFDSPCARVFLTEEEQNTVSRRFGRALNGADVLIGSGVDFVAGDGIRFRKRYGIHAPFMLYLGRVDESKGCGELLSYFQNLPGDMNFRLVLAGPIKMSVKAPATCTILGEIDEETKWDALAACDLFVMPSRFESLSFSLLEAWSAGKAAIVSGFSSVLVRHCRESNAGLWFRNQAEFEAVLREMTPPVRDSLGSMGRAYVAQRFIWDQTIERLSAVIENCSRSIT